MHGLKPTPPQKLRTAAMLYPTAQKVKLAALCRRYPEWSEDKLTPEVNRRLFLLHD